MEEDAKMEMDHGYMRAVGHVNQALRELGLTREKLIEPELDLDHTAERVVRMWLEMSKGCREMPPKVATFETTHNELLVLDAIPFVSLCSHHLAPFRGCAHIGYIPNKSLVGISKPARVLDYFAARPQTQELLTRQVADFLEEKLDKPEGLAVVLQAEHTCISCRGAQKPGSRFTTSVMRGELLDKTSARQEFLSLIKLRS